jgi:hypothetical protein
LLCNTVHSKPVTRCRHFLSGYCQSHEKHGYYFSLMLDILQGFNYVTVVGCIYNSYRDYVFSH